MSNAFADAVSAIVDDANLSRDVDIVHGGVVRSVRASIDDDVETDGGYSPVGSDASKKMTLFTFRRADAADIEPGDTVIDGDDEYRVIAVYMHDDYVEALGGHADA